MKYIDEFREPQKAKALIREIHRLAEQLSHGQTRPIRLMEFCGGHTHTIFRYGIEPMLPDSIELIHGPGCPVCILPRDRVDACIALAQRPEVIFTTFGDAMRVPGSEKSLLQAKAEGADIRMVYSPLDALTLARKHPNREVIFFALGFETTMPSTALTVLQARAENIGNFSLFCNHVTTIPTLKTLLDSEDFEIDGFIAPGHVSMVIGERPFDIVANRYQKPIVITGFEPLDILQSLWMLLKQFHEGRAAVENQYTRVVSEQGNPTGLKAMAEVFEANVHAALRGLGMIQNSGVRIREKYAAFDAERKFPLAVLKPVSEEPHQCADVLKGVLHPWQCPLFGRQCTPETPQGALMVSSEGACAAFYNFGRREKIDRREKTVQPSISLMGKAS